MRSFGVQASICGLGFWGGRWGSAFFFSAVEFLKGSLMPFVLFVHEFMQLPLPSYPFNLLKKKFKKILDDLK